MTVTVTFPQQAATTSAKRDERKKAFVAPEEPAPRKAVGVTTDGTKEKKKKRKRDGAEEGEEGVAAE